MLLKICDVANTFCQSFLLVWICNNIASRENKLTRLKSGALILLFFVEIVVLTYSGINLPLSNFAMFCFLILLGIVFYRKSIIDALIGIGFGYSVIMIETYFLIIFFQNGITKLNLNINTEWQMMLFIYVPVWISYFFIYKFRGYIFNAAIYLKSLKRSLVFILIVDYTLIFLDTLRVEWTTHDMGLIFKSFLYFVAILVFIFATIYFAKIHDRSKEVEMLNNALNDKITELKKIKHDYGSEISSLYGLYQLGKYDRLGDLLKSIIERNQAVNTAVSVSVKANPIVASILQSAVSANIDVIVSDSGDYDRLAITDNELIKLLSNIIKNSVEVLGGIENPVIKFKSYNSYNGIIITIFNNGPEIPEEIRNRIFQAGFSTKENKSSDRGYGLSIVRDIIDRCNGDISVESSKGGTQFKIEIPNKGS